jgi:hypothetical protein
VGTALQLVPSIKLLLLLLLLLRKKKKFLWHLLIEIGGHAFHLSAGDAQNVEVVEFEIDGDGTTLALLYVECLQEQRVQGNDTVLGDTWENRIRLSKIELNKIRLE